MRALVFADGRGSAQACSSMTHGGRGRSCGGAARQRPGRKGSRPEGKQAGREAGRKRSRPEGKQASAAGACRFDGKRTKASELQSVVRA